jgi:hypothetical protein
MDMTRLALLFAVVLATACATKPSSEDCRKAIENMQRLMGTDNMRDDGRIEGEVRRCKGGSTKKAVACAIKAQTLDDLRHCEFFKVPVDLPGAAGSAAATGSAAPATGSATGSAAAGSAATGSASGSAAPATGSAAGSAATGSAATGSASAPAGAGSAN